MVVGTKRVHAQFFQVFRCSQKSGFVDTYLLIWSMGSLLSDLEPSPPLDSPASSTEETTFSASASELRLASSRMASFTGAAGMAFTGGRM